jgi:alanyl-tRNA synthetase
VGSDESGAALVEIFVDVTPFYAEGGGQIGDNGTIAGPNGTANVIDTTYALPGLRRHVARITDGNIAVGDKVCVSVDGSRRDAIRRNHTGTHVLHWALRTVLGDHVRQQGSLVAPDRLRFDFAHHQAMTTDEIQAVEDLANAEILTNRPVEAKEVAKAEAEKMGAIAFFGDKYGDFVRVLHAGDNSLEFCGGTHVSALGDIGTVKIVSEGSIGSGIRRIEAVTGFGSLQYIRHEEDVLVQAASMLRTKPDELTDAIDRALARQKALESELAEARSRLARANAGALLEKAVDGIVAARVDELAPDQLRDLATTLRDQGARGVVLVGSPDGSRAAVAVVTSETLGVVAQDVVKAIGGLVGGGGGGKDPRLAVAGGKDISQLDEAVDVARAVLLGR